MLAQRGELMVWMGRHQEGADWVEKAMALDPLGAGAFAHLLGRAFRADHRYQDAIDAFRQVSNSRFQFCAEMAARHAANGDDKEAARMRTVTLRLEPGFSVAAYVKDLPYSAEDDRIHLDETLYQAGFD